MSKRKGRSKRAYIPDRDFCMDCLARLNRYFGWLSCPHCGHELKVRWKRERGEA